MSRSRSVSFALPAITLLFLAGGAAAEREQIDGVDAPIDREAIGEEAGCDPSAGGDVEELVEAEEPDRTIPTPLPERWRENEGQQCRRYNGRSMCDGPRRVPEPFGPAAELASSLGLDERRVGRVLMQGSAPREWVDAVEGDPGAGLLWPVPAGRLWRGYGRHRELRPRRDGSLSRGQRRIPHPGVDIGAPEGSEIRAVNDALVAYSFNGMRGYGNSLLLVHADGTVTLYAHCRATYVFAGQQVRRGQVIGEVGDTGLAHGAHLHFEWRRSGEPLDPLPHFVGRESEDRDRAPVASLEHP